MLRRIFNRDTIYCAPVACAPHTDLGWPPTKRPEQESPRGGSPPLRAPSISATKTRTQPALHRQSLWGNEVTNKIVIKHPWSGEMVERDISGLTPAELETY